MLWKNRGFVFVKKGKSSLRMGNKSLGRCANKRPSCIVFYGYTYLESYNFFSASLSHVEAEVGNMLQRMTHEANARSFCLSIHSTFVKQKYSKTYRVKKNE